jgi:hypothetical protein
MKQLSDIIREKAPSGLTRNAHNALFVFLHFSVFPDCFEAFTSTRGSKPESIIKDFLRQFENNKEFQDYYLELRKSNPNFFKFHE